MLTVHIQYYDYYCIMMQCISLTGNDFEGLPMDGSVPLRIIFPCSWCGEGNRSRLFSSTRFSFASLSPNISINISAILACIPTGRK